MAERTMSAESAIGQGRAWSLELHRLGCKSSGDGKSLSVKDRNGANVLTLTWVPGIGGLFALYDTALIEWQYGPGETAVPKARKGV